MKKILIVLFFFAVPAAKAQTYVTIPDTAFATWLQANFPSAMVGNQMDITSTAVTTTHTLAVQSLPIKDLTGVQYFSSLTELDCGSNLMKRLPTLPNTLTLLRCGGNPLDSIFSLPNSLQSFYVEHSPLRYIASLPASLTYFDCNTDSLSSLPALPNGLVTLICDRNVITSLPALPASLTGMEVYVNLLTSLPTLPAGLQSLDCDYNQLTVLPTLPSTLQNLGCSNNLLTSLPTLPAGLHGLGCANNFFTSLPTLPPSLQYLDCSSNQLTSLPAFPTSQFWQLYCSYNPLTSIQPLPACMNTLVCEHDSLTSLPAIPVGISYLRCSFNKITCFPTLLNSIQVIDISHNPNTCLPNHITAMDAATQAIPLCANGNPNNCPVTDTCSPNITFSLSQDSFAVSSWTIHPIYSLNSYNAVWYWGDGTSTSGFYPSHVYASSGNYMICATVFSACGDSLQTCHADSMFRVGRASSGPVYVNVQNDASSTGIEEIQSEITIAVFPNPVRNKFTLKVSGLGNSLIGIEITNMMGEKVYGKMDHAFAKYNAEVDLSEMAGGIYYARITSGARAGQIKILKLE